MKILSLLIQAHMREMIQEDVTRGKIVWMGREEILVTTIFPQSTLKRL